MNVPAYLPNRRRLTAAEAAARLRVKPSTLYTYVSRGLVRSERGPDGRTSYFDPAEIERFAARGRGGRRTNTFDLEIETALTLIDGDSVFYRGVDVLTLARTRTFEEVAEWLWTGAFPPRTVWRADPAAIIAGVGAQASLPPGVRLLDRLRVIADAAAPTDSLRYALHPEAVMVTARALLATLVDCLPALSPEPVAPPIIDGAPAPTGTLAARLWSRLTADPPAPGMLEVLNAALVLFAADEPLSASLAARIAASVRADPYAVVGAAFAVLSGLLIRSVSATPQSLFEEIGRTEQAPAVIGEHLSQGDYVAGFSERRVLPGHGRVRLLLSLVREAAPDRARLASVEAVLQEIEHRGLPPPGAEFANAALANVAGMVPGAGAAIQAVARTAGFIAHALEEYERDTTYVAHGVYIGLPPSGGPRRPARRSAPPLPARDDQVTR